MTSVERIGNYQIRELGPDKYSVSLTNGNMGAFITDKEGLEKFKEKYNLSNDTVELSEKKKGGTGKAIASALIPGLGQIIDGRTKDGLVDFGTSLGIGAIGTAIGGLGYKSFVKNIQQCVKTGAPKTPVGYYVALAASALTGIAAIANWVHSIADAYKGGKK